MVTARVIPLERRFNYDQRQKGRCYSQDPYRLPYQQWPEALAAELAAYQEWRTAALVLGRPPQCKQRSETFASSIIEFECYFGYLTNILNKPSHTLHLADICNVEWLYSYANWHAEHRSDGLSRFIEKTMADFLATARHYLKADAEKLEAMASLKAQVKPETVRDKHEWWNSLTTLEAIGLAEYPNGRYFPKLIYAAMAAQCSLIIRLLVRRPLRSRNIREMQLGKQLFQENGEWVIEFRDSQMKVARKQGRRNVFRLSFPDDLVPFLEEYLEVWRPILNQDDLPNVFVTTRSEPWSRNALNEQIKKTIYAYTGKATNVHLFRDIWATEFILRTQDFTTAAEMLNDDVQTVLLHYAHLRTQNACQTADKFLAATLETVQ
jgi:hypothetical protein